EHRAQSRPWDVAEAAERILLEDFLGDLLRLLLLRGVQRGGDATVELSRRQLNESIGDRKDRERIFSRRQWSNLWIQVEGQRRKQRTFVTVCSFNDGYV